jgi:UDP-N-acetylglucosamine 2-epimerase
MEIISIVGARPQFIKLAPMSRELRKVHDEFIVHTGQHYDYNMSEKLFKDLAIPSPNINLNIGSSSHGKQTGQMLAEIEKILLKEKPKLAIVFGDTNSTLAGALAAAKLHIPVMHIEAGLRSFNKEMPEEINRILTDHCADYLLAPTQTAADCLKNEGLGSKAFLSGDIMVDSVVFAASVAEEKSTICKDLKLKKGNYYLMTLHRPYNVDKEESLALILNQLGDVNSGIVFPVHPRTQNKMRNFGIKVPSNIKIIEPQGYLDFISLQKNAAKIITDSGGIQKEAYILGKPCITLRSETEWVETVENGWNKLVDIYTQDIATITKDFSPQGTPPKLFGQNVAVKMAAIINELFEQENY